jgi:hypothetical protein
VLAGAQRVGDLDISVSHASREVGFVDHGLTLSDGKLAATFVPAHA